MAEVAARLRLRARACYGDVTESEEPVPIATPAGRVAFMQAQSTPEQQVDPSHDTAHFVKVLPIDNGWCVAVGRGHYACPLSKAHAVFRASAIARSMQMHEIGVYDDERLIETIAC